MNLQSLRRGQKEALQVCLDRLKDHLFTSIVLPTRYGKSDVMRLVALLAHQLRAVSGSIIFSPLESLTDQIISRNKLQGMLERYELEPKIALNCGRLISFDDIRPFSNGEYFLSANIQLAQERNLGNFQKLLEYERARTGRPPLIFIDECQLASADLKWGKFFHTVAEKMDARVILMTATPIREDGGNILGFESDTLSETDDTRTVCTRIGNKKVRIDLYAGCEKVVKLRANHTTTFQQAWKEEPLPICRLSRITMDVDLRNVNGSNKMLSSLSRTDVKKVIGTIVRNPLTIDGVCEQILIELDRLRTIDPNLALIIRSGQDIFGSKSDNQHANSIKEKLEVMGPDTIGYKPSIKIIAQKREDNQKTSDLLNVFSSGNDNILIVKNVGAIGFDCPRIKGAVNLSPIRTVSSLLQFMTRAITPYGEFEVGRYCTLDDPIENAVWQKYVLEQDGAVDESGQWESEGLIDSWVVDEKDKPEEDVEVESISVSGFDDSGGKVGSLANIDLINEARSLIPDIGLKLTDAQISILVEAWGVGRESLDKREESQGSRPKTREEIIVDLKRQINDLATKVINAKVGGYDATSADDQNRYRSISKSLWSEWFWQCGLRPEKGLLKRLKNIDKLVQILQVVREANRDD